MEDKTVGVCPQKMSVCREFCDKFSKGKERVPEELVAFLQNHPSSRTKLDYWLKSTTEEERHADEKLQAACSGTRHQSVHDDCDRESGSSTDKVSSGTEIVDESAHLIDGEIGEYSKCNERSTRERELGNEYFKKKDLKKSLHHYNEAIRFATFPKEERNGNRGNGDIDDCLAIALANRSAVCSELGDSFYDNALQDADLALKFGYPERLKSKILLRKAGLHVKKCNLKCAKACLDEIYIKVPSCSSSNVRNVPEDIRPAKACKTCCDFHRKLYELEMQIENLQDKSMIQGQTSETLGRYVVALNDLEEGKLLFREEPFASVLLPELYASHCHHCHKQLQTFEGEFYFFPCRRCRKITFCSYSCFEAAELYHRIECRGLELLHSVGIAHLAMRIILVAGLDNVLYCVQNHHLMASNLELFNKGINSYLRVYSLVDHISDMYEEDLFQYTLTACLLSTFLETKSAFFSGVGEGEGAKVGGVLLRHICQLICNAHAITDVLSDSENSDMLHPEIVIDEYEKRIATAIFPAASIMNHSCDPNISVHFEEGKTLIVKVARQIGRNENVYNCYGPHFRRMSRSDRQEILSEQYFFNCNCDKCNTEEQLGVSFADQFSAFKCQNCEIAIERDSNLPCSTCGKLPNVKLNAEMSDVVCDLLKKGEYLMERNQLEEAVGVLELCHETSKKVLFKYNSQVGKICDLLARCYVLQGNPKFAEKYLSQSLEYVESRFGKTSLEYLRELKKYENVKN